MVSRYSTPKPRWDAACIENKASIKLRSKIYFFIIAAL